MLSKILEKLFDKILDALFEPIWPRLAMLIASPSISVYLAWAYEPLFLWFSGLIGFGFMLWIINQANTYRNNKKDKNFYETFLKFKASNNSSDNFLIEFENKKNIDYYHMSQAYDNESNPIFVIALAFIKPIYDKPKPTFRVRGDGNSHAVLKGFSFFEKDGYIYNMIFIATGIVANSSYVAEIMKNEE